MKTEDFDYDLPEELIAQTPLKNRDESKLLILDKNTGEITHSHFKNIIDTAYYTHYNIFKNVILQKLKDGGLHEF